MNILITKVNEKNKKYSTLNTLNEVCLSNRLEKNITQPFIRFEKYNGQILLVLEI